MYILRELKSIRQENLCCMFMNQMSTQVPLLNHFSVRENKIFCKASVGISSMPWHTGILMYEAIHLISFCPLKTHLSTYLNIETTMKCHSRCRFIQDKATVLCTAQYFRFGSGSELLTSHQTAQVWSHTNPHCICDGQSGSERSSPSTVVLSCYIPFTSVSHTFTHLQPLHKVNTIQWCRKQMQHT